MTKPLRLNLQLFGASASNNTSLQPSGSSTKAYTLTASFVENSTNTNDNTSSITATATLQANGTYWSTSYNSTLEIYWYDNRTGTETLKDSITFKGMSGYHDSKSVSSTFNVTHNNDGTLNGYAKAVFTKGSTTSSSAPPSGNVATALTSLTTIARVSNISCPNTYVGDTAIISIARNDISYTDTITYVIGGLSGTIATKTSLTSVSFDTSTIASSIYGQMSTTSTTVQCTLTVQTYNANNVSVGTKTYTFSLIAKENDCKPVADFDLVTTDQKSYDLTGNHTTIIKARSECTITYTITPRNGATIVSKWFDFGDGTASDELTASPLTGWQLIGPNLKLVTTDSRGFVTEVPKTFDFVDYDAPNVTINAYRTSPTGSEIKANFQGTFFNGSFGAVTNTLTLKAKYRIKGASTWTDLKTLVEDTDYTISNNTFYSGTGSVASDITLDSNVFNYQNTYEVAIFYNDAYYTGTNIYDSTFVSKGVPAFNWDDNLLNINGDLTISDNDGTNPVNVLTKINERLLKPTVLYSNGAGASGNITLTTPSTGFDIIEVYFAVEGKHECQRFYNYGGTPYFMLNGNFINPNNTIEYLYYNLYQLTANYLAHQYSFAQYVGTTGIGNFGTAASASIYLVLGYKL